MVTKALCNNLVALSMHTEVVLAQTSKPRGFFLASEKVMAGQHHAVTGLDVSDFRADPPVAGAF